MNIYEMILAGLQTKFQGVDAATLQRIASKKAEGVTDEGKVKDIVESVTFSDVLTNYGDFRANGASQTAKKNAIADYEKQHNLKDGKPVETQEPDRKQPIDMSAIAKMITDGVTAGIQPVVDRLNQFDAANAKAKRDAQIDEVAKSFKIPEFAYKGKAIPDDADLNKYFEGLKQEMQNAGFQFATAPNAGDGGVNDDVDSLVDTINQGTKAIEESNKQK